MTKRRKKHRPDEIVAKLRDADAMRCRVREGKQKAGQLEERLHDAVFRICSDAGTQKDALPRLIGGKQLFGQKKVPPRGVEFLQNPREIPQSRKIPDHIPDHFGWPPTSEIWFDSSRISRKGNAKPS